jgi:hypothetical protein
MKRNATGYPSPLFFESKSAQGPVEVVNLLAEFFRGVYVSEGEPVSSPTFDTLHRYLLSVILEEAILELDEQKNPGPDGISPSILKKLVSVGNLIDLVNLIDWHFSCCLESILCHSDFQEWLFSCYREISILSVIPKLFEKMICDQITPITWPQISVMQHSF